jgi:hypothetical protein
MAVPAMSGVWHRTWPQATGPAPELPANRAVTATARPYAVPDPGHVHYRRSGPWPFGKATEWRVRDHG